MLDLKPSFEGFFIWFDLYLVEKLAKQNLFDLTQLKTKQV